MSCEFLDGFESGDLKLWDLTPYILISSIWPARTANYCAQSLSVNEGHLYKQVTERASYIFGCRVCLPSTNYGYASGSFLAMYSGVTCLAHLYYDHATGRVSSWWGDWKRDGTEGVDYGLIAEGNVIVDNGVTFYIEWYFLPHITTGAVITRIGGIEDINVSGIQTTSAVVITGGVVSSGGSGTLTFNTNLTQVDHFFDGGTITFTSGANNGLSRTVQTYLNTSGEITVTVDLSAQPSPGDTFSIFPAAVSIDGVGCVSGAPWCAIVWDDIWLDTENWPGSVRIQARQVVANGTYDQWDPSAPGDSYGLVDEIPASETDYIFTNTVNKLASYEGAPLSGNPAVVRACQVEALIQRRGMSTPENAALLIISDGTEDLSADIAVPYSYSKRISHAWETDPATGLAWEVAAASAFELGVKSKA